MTVRFRLTAALALLAAALFLVPGSASAASFPEEKGVSIGAFGGASFPFEGSYGTGWLAGAMGDYSFSKAFAARVSFSYVQHSTTVPGGGDFSSGQLLLSAVYNLGGDRLVPFVTGGLGFYNISPPEGGTTGRGGLHAGGGVEYFLNRRTSILGQGLFHFVNGVSDRGGSSFQLGAGVRYYF